MPIRFTTEAANADHLRAEAETDGMSDDVGADGTPRDRGQSGQPRGKAKDEQPGGDEARPGKDINAPGLIKEKDSGGNP